MEGNVKILALTLIVISLRCVTANPVTSQKEAKKCLAQTKILSEEDGKCYDVTSQEPCREGEWLVLRDRDTLIGSCQPRLCQKMEEVEVDGICEIVWNSKWCVGRGERLYVNVYGKGECDCEDGWYRHSDGECYQENTQGWCGEGDVLRKIGEVRNGECRTTETERRSNQPCVFPWKYKGKMYDGCKNENDGLRWCSTKVDENGDHMKGEWGQCDEECPSAGFPDLTMDVIVFSVNEALILQLISKLKATARKKLVCGENRCLSGSLWWEDIDEDSGEMVGQCYEIFEGEDLSNCVVELSKSNDNTYDKLVCESEITEFSIAQGRTGTCGRGRVWSHYRRRCVGVLRG